MADESEHVDAGHDVEFRSLGVRSILNRSVSKRLHWMAWSINPYRGCEFGCRYCYARYTHEFLAPAEEPVRGVLAGDAAAFMPSSNLSSRASALSNPTSNLSSRSAAEESAVPPAAEVLQAKADPSTAPRDDSRVKGQESFKPNSAPSLRNPEAFERRIFVKDNAAWLLEQDLRRLAKQGRLHEEIALGTATDPWQPIERRTQLTRSLLEVMARRDGLRLGIVTKSTLIERDLDLLLEIHRRSTLVVHITITTPDAELARKLEPRAPRPDLRFATVRRLRQAGIRTGILNSPLLPGITDTPEAIDAMAALAKQADASFFAGMPLFLKPCSRPTYFDFVREHFPHLQVLYAEKFRDMDFAARPYQERLRALVSASCRRHGLTERATDSLLTRDAGEEKKQSASAGYAQAQGLLFG
jgi:DNA repair photolyase